MCMAASLHVFLAGLTLTVAVAQAQPGLSTAVVGIASGQSARVSALNLGSSASTADSSCTVAMQFLDAQRKVVKEAPVSLQPGKAASLDLSHEELPGSQLRSQIPVVLLFGDSGGAPPGPEVLLQFDCNIVPSLEVYDAVTGRTSLLLTDAKPLPANGRGGTSTTGVRRMRMQGSPR